MRTRSKDRADSEKAAAADEKAAASAAAFSMRGGDIQVMMGDASRFEIFDDAPPMFMLEIGSRTIGKQMPLIDKNDDAYFGNVNAMGVFDGVSACNREVGDVGVFSRKLSLLCAASESNPYRRLVDADSIITEKGLATACVARVAGSRLQVANLGDSGFRVLRDCKMIARSVDQFLRMAHGDCPYALGRYRHSQYDPSCADPYVIELHKGDVVVLGSDGLYDSMSDAMIESVARGTAQEIADRLFEGCFVAPWIQRRERGNDDITVMVGVVS